MDQAACYLWLGNERRISGAMDRKYDLLAICLLMFTVALVTAMTFDPKGFSVKDWQTLMAAFIALFGASMVFRGATLAYDAALKKIDLDREIHKRELHRRQNSIYLKATFAAHVVHHDARSSNAAVGVGSIHPSINPSTIKIREMDTLEEIVWQQLEIFPIAIAQDLSDIRIAYFNLLEAKEVLGDTLVPLAYPPSEMLTQMREALESLETKAKAARDAINVELGRNGL